MMQLSRSSEYAINVALQLARATPAVPISAAELARAGRMPERYLQHILRRLAKNGVLHVTRGVAGGYELARAPRQITLLNLVEAVEKSSNSKRSVTRGLGTDSRTRLTKALQSVSRSANDELQNVTVADLMRQKRRRNGR
jgi:Rrf2 family protein